LKFIKREHGTLTPEEFGDKNCNVLLRIDVVHISLYGRDTRFLLIWHQISAWRRNSCAPAATGMAARRTRVWSSRHHC
jgi:hypothetical protein